MKKTCKKLVSLLLTLVITLSVLTAAPFAVSAVTENEIVSWMDSKNGTTIYDGGSQCVAAFNSYLRLWGISSPISQYPVSYAYQIFNYNAPDGWQKISGSGNYRVGDIVIWGSSVGGGCGHVGMVYSTSGGTVKIFDQNYVAKRVCGIHDISQTGAIRGVFRPPLDNNTNPPTNVWSDYSNYLPGDVTVHWSPAENAESYWVSGYITYSDGSVYCFMGENVGNTTEHKMTLLETGKYTIFVSSVNGDYVSATNFCSFDVILKPTTPQCLKTCTYNGHTYKLYSSSKSWESAKEWCESNGGYLATVTSKQEQAAIWNLIEDYSNMSFYLGGTNTSGSWEWVTGEEFQYTTWAENQPDCAGNAEFYLGTWGHTNANENLKYWNDFTNNYSGMAGFVYESGDTEENSLTPIQNIPTVNYSVYTGDKGWYEDGENGEVVGVENGSRFRAVKLKISNRDGGIKYSAHFSDVGWSDYINDYDICGSTDEGSSIEAVRIKLYGDIANYYNIYYCTCVRDLGWLGWAKNGEISGTTDGSLPITAIKIMLVPKVEYTAHLENKGWQTTVNENETSGTIGESCQIEAIKLQIKDTAYGSVKYSTHIEDIGWAGFVYNGTSSGTTGLQLQTEAIRLKLEGKAGEMFDIIYKVHVQDKGWLDWSKNGGISGTVGESLRIEAYKALIVPKGFIFNEASYKKLTQEKYTVTFDSTGGVCDTESKLVSYCGFYGDLPTPQKSGCVFCGWYESTDKNEAITSTSTLEKKSNVVLCARWLPIGDVDGDGIISVSDATALQKQLADGVEFGDEMLAVADANGDGIVSVSDATLIQKYLAGNVTALG